MRSTLTSLRALDLVAVRQPIGVSELARLLEVPKPNAQRALRALADGGWIRHGTAQPGKWVLTAKALDIARHVGQEAGLREIALPSLNRLAGLTTEAAHLAVLDGTDIVITEEVPSTQVVRIHWPIGNRSPAYASANGKAILAALPEEHVDRHLPAQIEQHTSETITDPGRLRAELEVTRRRGYATQRGELRPDVASVAAAICVGLGRPVASVSVFLPNARFPADGGIEIGKLVLAAAETIGSLLATRADP